MYPNSVPSLVPVSSPYSHTSQYPSNKTSNLPYYFPSMNHYDDPRYVPSYVLGGITSKPSSVMRSIFPSQNYSSLPLLEPISRPAPVLCGIQSSRMDYEQTMSRHENIYGLSKMWSFLIIYSCKIKQIQRQ